MIIENRTIKSALPNLLVSKYARIAVARIHRLWLGFRSCIIDICGRNLASEKWNRSMKTHTLWRGFLKALAIEGVKKPYILGLAPLWITR